MKPNPSILTIDASFAEEQSLNLREIFPEECALAAAIHLPNASQYVYDCLMLQEHRGEHSVGLLSLHNGKYKAHRRIGSVKEQFLGVDFATQFPGNVAIGHNRYATKGASSSLTNIQPLFFNHSCYGAFAIAHNGTLVERQELREELTQKGVLFQSTMDSELFGHLIAQAKAKTLEDAVAEAARDIPAAYALLVMNGEKIIALRDRYGVRPLSIGKLHDGYLICSESVPFDQYPECRFVDDIQPGEMVVFDYKKTTMVRRNFTEPEEHFCIFEGIYFSDPRSRYNGYWHEDFRYQLGQKMLEENPDIQGDCIIPILDSGKHAALGLATASSIPYREYFRRLPTPPRASRRAFTAATEKERIRTAHQKLHLRKEKVKGKNVVIVDDSIVRSTTIRIITQRLREAGAKTITVCITAPAITNTCPYGMDFQERNQLIAYNRTVEDIRQKVGADRLLYLSLEGLQKVASQAYQCGLCTGCFGGHYPSLEKKTEKP